MGLDEFEPVRRAEAHHNQDNYGEEPVSVDWLAQKDERSAAPKEIVQEDLSAERPDGQRTGGYEMPDHPWGRYFLQSLKEAGIEPAEYEKDPLHVALRLLVHQDEPRYSAFVRDFSEDLEETIIATARRKPEEFAIESAKYLDFVHPESFADTASILEIFRSMYIQILHDEQDDLDVEDYHGTLENTDPAAFKRLTQGSSAWLDVLHNALERKEGSYLLYERAKQVYQGLTNPRKLEFEHVDVEPFQIAPHTYAGFNHDKSALYIAPPESINEIDKYLQSPAEDKDNLHYSAFYSAVIDAGDRLDEQRLEKVFGVGDVSAGDFRDYYFLQSEPIRQKIIADFGVPLSDLTIREQFHLLDFLKNVRVGEARHIQSFTKEYGTIGLRTFLALEELGPDFGWVIAGSGNAAAAVGAKEPAEFVFRKFVETDAAALDAEKVLRESFRSADKGAAHEIAMNVRRRAADLFRRLLAEPIDNTDETRARLEVIASSINKDTLLFTSACRVLRERGELSLKEIRGSSLEVVVGERIAAQDREAILNIWMSQYQDKYPEEKLNELRAELENALASPYSRFYLYRKDGEIITFVRFDDLTASNDESKHMGSFMTNPLYEGGALGQALLEVALRSEMQQGGKIYAECDPERVEFYEKFGFRVIRGPYEDDSGVKTYDIVLEPSSEESERKAA
ncbi:MAG: GNAT family N-acetyltransferase [Patescibacteria group bacterium]|nr:GNAT family N-acetyltransferase [Patescibacteria group bacterium]